LKKLNLSKSYIDLCDLHRLYNTNVLSAEVEVDLELLRKVGAVRDNSTVLRFLASGELSIALQISVPYASDAAIRGVESAGGKIPLMWVIISGRFYF
jgi:ribosomal protein L15